MTWLEPAFPMLWSGFLNTLRLFALSALVMFPVAFILAFGRSARSKPIKIASGFAVEFWRGSSAIVQLFWVYFALPSLGLPIDAFTAAVLVLGINLGAYYAETVRAGISSVSVRQREASIALNLSPWRRFRRITLPLAIPFMIPDAGNRLIQLLKFTTLASLVTVGELTSAAQHVRTWHGHTAEVFGMLLVVYFIVSMTIGAITRFAERRVNRYLFGSKQPNTTAEVVTS